MIRTIAPLEFTQGTIFTCATAENYEGPSTVGMVITARCDAAHEKVEIYNYVPVVPIESWILRDGRELLAKRASAAARGAMRAVLTDAGMAPVILESLALNAIQEELEKDISKKGRGIAIRFSKAADLMSAAVQASGDEVSRQDSFTYLEANEGDCKRLIGELLANALADFHYLTSVQPGETSCGYVALLREIRFVSASLAKGISGGLDRETYEALAGGSAKAAHQLQILSDNDFAMPIGAVESPHIELIMQRLTQLFSRIGVADIPKERADSVQSLLDSMRRDF
ncbi:MAG TPA: hypothetical protein VEX35_01800 [Allosphingosinicella sp.]|nr:hypothetical protein [Allosphingosinicella sp.]